MKPILLTLIGTLAVGFLLCLPARGQSAQDLLQQGVRLEQVQGDYEGAIALYRRVVADAGAERRLVAQALIQLGKAYESLGRTEAFSAYDRVAREFADQADLVAEARVRLRALAPAGVAAATDPNVITFGILPSWYEDGTPAVSNSGRLVARSDGKGGLDLLDLESGEVRTVDLGEMGCAHPGVWPLAFSNDDSMVAVQCSHNRREFWSMAAGYVDLRSGQAMQVVSAEEYFGTTNEPGRHMSLAVPFGWTADGKSLLVKVWNVTEWAADGSIARQTIDVGLVPIDGSAPTVISHLVDVPSQDPFLVGGCVMGNDTVLISQYSAHEPGPNSAGRGPRGQIRSTVLATGTERPVLESAASSFELFGCDPERGVVYYSQSPRGLESGSDRRSLWVAEITNDGELEDLRMLQGLPEDASPLLSRGGKVAYLDARDSWVHGVYRVGLDPESGLLVGEPEMIDVMASGSGRPEVLSGDGRQLMWRHFSDLEQDFRYFVSEDGSLFKPVDPAFESPTSLFIQGDRYGYSNATGTYVANWKTGAREETLADGYYTLASPDLRYLYRLDGHRIQGMMSVSTPVDGPRCVRRLDRVSGAEEELFCVKATLGADFADLNLRVDPLSGRVAAMYRDAESRLFSLEVYDPETGSSAVLLQQKGPIFPVWAGGRLYTETHYPLAFSRIDPVSGARESLDWNRITKTVKLPPLPNFWFLVSPDEREMYFYGSVQEEGYEASLVVIKDPLASK